MHCQWDITVILLLQGIHSSFLFQLREITSHKACTHSSLFMKGLFKLKPRNYSCRGLFIDRICRDTIIDAVSPCARVCLWQQMRSVARMAGALQDEGFLLHVCRLASHAFIRIFSAHARISPVCLWLSGDAAKGRGSSIR